MLFEVYYCCSIIHFPPSNYCETLPSTTAANHVVLKIILILSPEAYHAEFHDSTHLTLTEKNENY